MLKADNRYSSIQAISWLQRTVLPEQKLKSRWALKNPPPRSIKWKLMGLSEMMPPNDDFNRDNRIILILGIVTMCYIFFGQTLLVFLQVSSKGLRPAAPKRFLRVGIVQRRRHLLAEFDPSLVFFGPWKGWKTYEDLFQICQNYKTDAFFAILILFSIILHSCAHLPKGPILFVSPRWWI